MKNHFIIRLKTSDLTKQEIFWHLLSQNNMRFQLIHMAQEYEENKEGSDTYYRVCAEPLDLISIKNLIDTRVEYEVLELFEFESW